MFFAFAIFFITILLFNFKKIVCAVVIEYLIVALSQQVSTIEDLPAIIRLLVRMKSYPDRFGLLLLEKYKIKCMSILVDFCQGMG